MASFISTQKFVRMSPIKIRQVAYVARGLTPEDAVKRLPFTYKRAAAPLVKVIKTAMANAKNSGVSADKLVFKEIQVGEGPRLKRGREISRGMWHQIIKKMSHIRVVLETKEPAKEDHLDKTSSKGILKPLSKAGNLLGTKETAKPKTQADRKQKSKINNENEKKGGKLRDK